MISLNSLEVFIISGSSLFLFLMTFSYRTFKNSCLSGASFQHTVAHQWTSIAPGTQTVLRNRAIPGIQSCASLLSARRSNCWSFSALAGQYMFFESVISGEWQSCRTVLDLRASNCRGLTVLRPVNCRGFLYSPGTIMLPQQSCGQELPGTVKSCRTVLVL